MEVLFGDLLPRDVLGRETKGRFAQTQWREGTRRFLSTWDGDGLPPELESLVDPLALRAEWAQAIPSYRTAMLTQALWLDGGARPSGYVGLRRWQGGHARTPLVVSNGSAIDGPIQSLLVGPAVPGRLRPVRSSAIVVIPVAALTGWVAACGGGSPATTTQHGPGESAQRLPNLPAGWKPRRDRTIGYAIGVPTGWRVSERGRRALFRSPDHLVAVTLTADRTRRTFRIPVERFASKALGALPGFKVPLQAAKPKRFAGTPLEAASTTATGAQASGLRERATLIVLRRDHLVNYTVAVVGNAERPESELDRAVALRMVRTLRDVPPKGPAAR
jgi:hypothetical protein